MERSNTEGGKMEAKTNTTLGQIFADACTARVSTLRAFDTVRNVVYSGDQSPDSESILAAARAALDGIDALISACNAANCK